MTDNLIIETAVGLIQIALLWPLKWWLGKRSFSITVTISCTAAMILAGALLRLGFITFELTIEQHSLVLWSIVCLSAVATGALSSAITKRMPTLELALSTAFVFECATLFVFLVVEDVNLATPPVRALIIAPAIVGLAIYFGASVGYLLFGSSGRTDMRLGYEAIVGRRFLLSKSTSVLSTVTTISVVGVTLGVWLVIVALGILAGFEYDLQQKIIGANAHVVIQRNHGRTFTLPRNGFEKISKVAGVAASAAFISGEVAFASRSNYTGGLVYGIDPIRSPKVLSVLGNLPDKALKPFIEEEKQSGKDSEPILENEDGFLPPAKIPSIIIGIEMQKALNVNVGDKIRIISPLITRMTPVGMVPSSQAFRVAAVFSLKMYEFDARSAYITLGAARSFFEYKNHEVSGIQMRVSTPEYANRVGESVVAALGGAPYQSLDWRQRNLTLFSALELERVVAFVVLVFIILVASFSIVNTLTMSVIEKKKEIAILKTMGARAIGIMKVFLVQGMIVGVFGTILGAGLALFTVYLLKTVGFWIPGEVYYIDSLPVNLEVRDVILVVLAAFLIVWDFAVFPALSGSKLEPVEGLRDG